MFFAAASLFLVASMALKISGMRLHACLLTGPVYVPFFHISKSALELCKVILHSKYECASKKVRCGLRRRAKERTMSENVALRACLSKDDVEEWRPPSEQEGTCKTSVSPKPRLICGFTLKPSFL